MMEFTYRVTVLLGRKLGCSVSIRSTSSHTTLTWTCCLLSSLDLSAEQWQLSTIRSGQFLLLKLDCHSPTSRHNTRSAFMVTGIFFAPRSFQVISSVSRCPPTRQSPTCDRVRISCPAGHLLSSRHLCSGTSRMTKPEENVHMEGCDAPCYHSVRNCSLRCGVHRKLSKSAQTLLRHILSKRRSTQTCGWHLEKKKRW